ncbi:MAG: DUF4258 domain-containing protein [Clostridia bacterium]|nr:DUF4258 domain-containing protein [Clostridia bacterium]
MPGGVLLNDEQLRKRVASKKPLWTLHAIREAVADDLDPIVVSEALRRNGEIIEDYPEDKRSASCLVLCHLPDGRPVHAVVGYAYEPVRIITVYRPDLFPERWTSDYRRRR